MAWQEGEKKNVPCAAVAGVAFLNGAGGGCGGYPTGKKKYAIKAPASSPHTMRERLTSTARPCLRPFWPGCDVLLFRSLRSRNFYPFQTG